MNLYELVYLINPKMTNEEVEEFNEKITNTLKDEGAKLYKMDEPKKRSLAYKIDDYREAYLASIDMDASTEKIKVIEERLKREDNVIRFLIVAKEELEEEEEEEKEEEKTENKEEEKKDKEEEEEKKTKSKKEKKEKKEKKVKLKEIDEKIDEIL